MFNEHVRLQEFGEALMEAVKKTIEQGKPLSSVVVQNEIQNFHKAKGSLNELLGSLSDVIYSQNSVFLRREDETIDNWMDRSQSELDKLMEVSDALEGDNIVGAVLDFPVADGSALYVVRQQSPLVIEHLPYIDEYHAPAPLLKGLDVDFIKMRLNEKKHRKNALRN